MSAQHTSGPWQTGHDGDERLWIGPNYDELAVAHVDWDCLSARDNSRANARLISAAPELLDALVRLRRRFHNACAAVGSDAEYVALSTPDADAAIAKAVA